MFRSRRLVCALMLAAGLLISSGSYAKGDPAPEEMTGLKIGDTVPDFKLNDQNGKAHTLKSLLAKEGTTVLVFFRSANWWPYCKKQLGQLQLDAKKMKDAGINIVAISYDSIEVLKRFSDKNEVTYPMLSDDGSTLIDAFGIRNKTMDGKKFGKNDLTGIPHPGTYILDGGGVILGKLFLERYQERHSNDALIEKVAEVVK